MLVNIIDRRREEWMVGTERLQTPASRRSVRDGTWAHPPSLQAKNLGLEGGIYKV